MSASLGTSVLVLSTNQQPLRQGLTEARAETIRQTDAMRNAARIELRANLLRLQGDYQQGQLRAREYSQQAARQAAFDLRVNLVKYQSDLRQAERLQAESLRAMRQQAQQAGGGGLLSGLGGDIATGLGIGSGAAVVQTALGALGGAVGAGKSAFIDYNSAIENTQAQLLALTRDAAQSARILTDLRAEADRTPFTFQELSGSIAALLPVSKQTGESLQGLIKTAEILAALNPQQGFGGAVIALANAAAGQTQSIEDRFNISRQAITRFKDQGLTDLQAVRAALQAMGADETLVGNLSLTFTGRLSTLQDALSGLAGRAGQPIFAGTKQAITDLTTFLASPQVLRAVEGFTTGLAATLTDPQVRDGAKQLALAIGDIAGALGETTKVGGAVAGGGVLGLLALSGNASKALRDLGDDLINAEKRLDGTDIAAKTLLATLSGNPATFVGQLASDLDHINKLLADPKLEKWLDAHLPGGGPGTGAVRIPTAADLGLAAPLTGGGAQGGERDRRVRPEDINGGPGAARPIAVPPPEEAQFDITANKNRAASATAAYQQGLADLQAYLRGFGSGDFDLFGKLKPRVEASFQSLFGDLDLSQQFDKGLGNLDVLTARLVDDIRKTGSVSSETAEIARAALGSQAEGVIALANQYGALAASQDRAAQAASNLKGAQEALGLAQQAAAAHQQEVRDNVDELQRSLAALNKEAQGVAGGYAEQIRQAQAAQTAAQQAQAALQEQATRNAAAYQAVLSGTTDEYERQNALLSDQERQIIANGNAQVRAALAAKTAQDSVVKGLSDKEDALRLDFDERIRAARNKRTPAGDREANALTEQRDREIAKLEYQLQLERERATVRGNEAEAAKKPVEEAAAAQAAADKQASDAAGKRAAEAGQRVSDLQEQARLAAADYAARSEAIQATIDKEEERGRVLARVDKKAIDDAQTRVDNAKTTKDDADQEVIAQGKITDALGAQNTLLDTRFKAWKDFYDNVLKPAGAIIDKFNAGAPPPPPAAPPGYTTSPVPGNVDDPSQSSLSPPPPRTGPGGQSRVAPGDATFFSRAALPAYQAPVPPASNLAAYSTLGAGMGGAALAGAARGPVTFSAPITVTGNQFTSDIDIQRAMQEAAAMQARTLLAALGEDDRGGGSASNWRA